MTESKTTAVALLAVAASAFGYLSWKKRKDGAEKRKAAKAALTAPIPPASNFPPLKVGRACACMPARPPVACSQFNSCSSERSHPARGAQAEDGARAYLAAPPSRPVRFWFSARSLHPDESRGLR